MVTPARPRVDVRQRRARLAVRHRLAAATRTGDPAAVAAGLVALHSSDPASVYLAIRARTHAVSPADIGRSLYRDRSMVRLLGMRRTMFVVPAELAPVVQAAATRTVAARERGRLVRQLSESGLPDADGWLDEVQGGALRALAALGEATGAQLSTAEPRLRTRVTIGPGAQTMTTRVLLLLGAEGRIMRGRPHGSWTSSQYHWSLTERWLPGGLADVATEQAQRTLVRRWLAAYGPAPVDDLRWWTGWTAGEVRRALAPLGVVEVDLDGGDGVPRTGVALPDDLDPTPDPEPWVALLPALDPTPMAWSRRDWFLGEHAAALFDRSGNIGPTVWADGRIVGGWAQRASGEVVYRLLEDVGAEAGRAVADEVARLADWLGPVRVTPRFRTPLERDLAG